jgi:hypothetical protein
LIFFKRLTSWEKIKSVPRRQGLVDKWLVTINFTCVRTLPICISAKNGGKSETTFDPMPLKTVGASFKNFISHFSLMLKKYQRLSLKCRLYSLISLWVCILSVSMHNLTHTKRTSEPSTFSRFFRTILIQNHCIFIQLTQNQKVFQKPVCASQVSIFNPPDHTDTARP